MIDKKKLVIAIYVLSYYLGIVNLFYYFTRRKQLVVTYHNVIPASMWDGALHLGVSCDSLAFRAQMEIISRKFKSTIKVGEPGSCLITFDDGYSNNAEIAATVLKDYHLNGIFFVPLKNYLNKETIWVDNLTKWISYVPNGEYRLLDSSHNISDIQTRITVYSKIYQRILNSYQDLDEILKNMEDQYSFSKLEISPEYDRLRFDLMNNVQIDRLKAEGHVIACHALKHDVLSCLSKSCLLNDFNECEKEIGNLYNSTYYSYPFGGKAEVSDDVIDACQNSRFSCAFMNITESAGNYSIPRISLPNTRNKYEIHAKLSGLEYTLKKLIGI